MKKSFKDVLFELIHIDFRKRTDIIFIAFSAAGLILGVIFLFSSETAYSDDIFLSDFCSRRDASFFSVFISSVFSYSFFILLVFLFGFTPAGIAAPFLAVFTENFFIGVCVSFIYSLFGFYGMLYFIVVLLPGIYLKVVLLIYSSKISFCFSLMFYKDKKNSFASSYRNKEYISKFLYIFIFSVLASLTDAFFGVIFSKLFTF